MKKDPTVKLFEGLGWEFIADGKGAGTFFKDADYEDVPEMCKQVIDYKTAVELVEGFKNELAE
jgi:hypothetical protein